MSADAWRICPKCGINAVSARDAAIAEADKAYGKIPAHQWAKLHDAAHAIPESEPGETLREDYVILMGESGTFYINYSCSCSNCGFWHKFKYEKQVIER